ncbi:MAG TPA: hypothetical protein VIT65_24035 [Microlunatus sp.]
MITSRSARVSRPLLSLTLAPVVALSCGLLLLAGCSSTSTATPGSQPSTGAQDGSRGGMGGAADPGRVSGEIAAVDGKTLQIQDGSAQTAVTYTGKTTFTAQVAGSISDLAKGDCVVVFSSSTDQNASAVTASTVSVADAVDGTCAAGFGGGSGGRPTGAPSGQPSTGGQPPSAAPGGGQPSGAPSAGMPNGGGRPRSGKVTAISGDTFTVAVSQPGSKETTDVTVTTTDKTTVTVTEASKASAAKAGVCATVNGKAHDTGAVTAATITLRDAGADGCTARRGNR